MAKRNQHVGSKFDDFLRDEGMLEAVQAKALKRALSEQIEEGGASVMPVRNEQTEN